MNVAAVQPQPIAAAGWLHAVELQVFRVERWLCCAALVVMLLTVAFSVVVRFFGLRIPNVAEWAIVAMSPLTFVGAALCTYLQEYIAVDVVKLLPHRGVRRFVRGTVALSLLGFAGVYAWIGTTFFRESLHSGETLLDMGTPVAVPVFFVMTGMLLMLFHAALEMFRVLAGQPAVAGEGA